MSPVVLLDLILPVVVILLMISANALYVAAEFATVGSRRSRVQESAEGGSGAAQRLLLVLKDRVRLDNYVAGCQVGITLSSLVAGAYGQSALTPRLTPLLGPIGGETAAVLVVLVLITVLQVVLGELMPKTVALRYPERLALATLAPMRVSLWLFKPLIRLFNGTAFFLMRKWGLHVEHGHAHVHSPEELEGLYRESAAGGLIDASERDMLAGALNVDERLVREIMTPRSRLVMAAAGEPVGTALQRLASSPYSRFPVAGERSDEVVGVIHLRALFVASESGQAALAVSQIMKPPLVVAEVMSVPRLWQTLRDAGRHSAMVVNEYGTVAGMVTLEDALEEIFGELQDEFDQEQDTIIEHEGRISIRGDVRVRAVNQRFALDLPLDDADTMGGLVWHGLGQLPEVGDEVALLDGRAVLRVEAVDGRGVGRVQLIRQERAP